MIHYNIEILVKYFIYIRRVPTSNDLSIILTDQNYYVITEVLDYGEFVTYSTEVQQLQAN